MISGADRHIHGKLKDKLANNYLLKMGQYTNTLEKTLCILRNYQTTRNPQPFRPSPNNIGVAFCKEGEGGVGQDAEGKDAAIRAAAAEAPGTNQEEKMSAQWRGTPGENLRPTERASPIVSIAGP